MNVHENARLTTRGREWLVRQVASGQTPKAVGEAIGVCPRTVRKWLNRHEKEGLVGLEDRSSRPHRLYRPTPHPIVERIETLRRERLTGKAVVLAIVRVDGGFASEPIYVKGFFKRELGFAETAVVFKISDLVTLGSRPT